jgi:hypothetical protein
MEEVFDEQVLSGASLEEKMDMLLRINLDIRKSLAGTVHKLETVSVKVETHDKRIEEIEKKLSDTVKELHSVQVSSNSREQSYRLDAVRLFGLPPIEDETDPKTLVKHVYTKALLPILNLAKSKGQLDVVPTRDRAGITCFRAGKKPPSRTGQPSSLAQPLPVIIKFEDLRLRLMVLRYKREGIPSPSAAEKAAGFSKMFISEDLTPATFKAMKQLRNSDQVAKVWSVEGQVRFTLAGDSSGTIKKVQSVFVPVDEMISSAK